MSGCGPSKIRGTSAQVEVNQCQVPARLLVMPEAPDPPVSPDPEEFVIQVMDAGYHCAIIYDQLNSLIRATNANRETAGHQ